MLLQLYGGLISGYYNPETKVTDVARIDVPKVDIILTIPPYELRTEDSRNVLPETFSHKKQYKIVRLVIL